MSYLVVVRASACTEVYAHAVRFRDLRNYGLHLREDISDAESKRFTEAGCALLLMDAHRC